MTLILDSLWQLVMIASDSRFAVTLTLMAYILLDESGDLGFSAHSSKFFIVTILFTDSKRPLERVSRRVHKTLSKKFKKVGVLHAYNEEPVTRQRLLHQVSALDCSVLAIVLNKSKVYTKLHDEKAVLYNYVTNILLDRLFTKKPVPLNGPVHLIASKRETNKFLNHNFTESSVITSKAAICGRLKTGH
jgi:arsenate reductase-like glutaredoxin family protein